MSKISYWDCIASHHLDHNIQQDVVGLPDALGNNIATIMKTVYEGKNKSQYHNG